MDKTYDPKSTEEKIYQMWESGGYFIPKINQDKKPFSILLPPPNANADLHLGHAMYVIEDIMIRYHRMKGDPTLWLPGADHAGFETQYVFEKQLNKEGKSRFDFPREELYKMIWDFVQKNRGTMENQLRRLGFSLDWTRNTFMLDPKIVAIVYKTFKKLYDDRLVYRSDRLVNYCVKDGTSFSDLEVVHKDIDGFLYFIHYPLAEDTNKYITVATTRPETMFADVAIMVHPTDKKYKDFIGKEVIIPLVNRKIKVIADNHVDKKFGTGAVKVTPQHDFNDEEVAKRHGLDTFHSIITFSGKMIDTGYPEIDGLKIIPAREKTIQLLTDRKLLDQPPKPHKMVIKICYKCGSTLEPLSLPQWYVKVKLLTEKAIDAIKNKNISFVPKRFEKLADRWLQDFHDWNISRQIAWGIKVPVWYEVSNDNENRIVVSFINKSGELKHGTIGQWLRKKYALDEIKNGIQQVIVPVFEHEANQPAIHIGDNPPSEGNWIQETDVFDTWFSSGQWPFATLQATSDKGDFKYFYPTSVLETGYDILPWWVCRMIMLGLYVTGDVPFRTVYLHGLVRDSKGQKMSKSKGNVINPLKMIDLYGTDALRMSLVYGTAAGNDQSLSEDKIRGMRNFANKLWNIGRFLLMDTDKKELKNSKFDKELEKTMPTIVKTTTDRLDKYQFGQTAEWLYYFIWQEFADGYIERYKEGKISYSILFNSFLTLLKLLHPFMPFVTEAIWSNLPKESKKPLVVSSWPEK